MRAIAREFGFKYLRAITHWGDVGRDVALSVFVSYLKVMVDALKRKGISFSAGRTKRGRIYLLTEILFWRLKKPLASSKTEVVYFFIS